MVTVKALGGQKTGPDRTFKHYRSWFEAKFFPVLDHSFGGHSLRAGGAILYASLGLSEDIIQALGRWSSAAWKIYIRENPIIHAELQLAAIRLHHL